MKPSDLPASGGVGPVHGAGRPPAPALLSGAIPPRPAVLPAAVELKGISKAFGRNIALANVDLAVPQGGSMLISGPNGAGKSTLLRIIATAIWPTYGEGLVLGCDLKLERAGIRAATELLGHRTRLYEDLTPLEYLKFVQEMWSCHQASAPEALERLGLWKVREERIRGFSQGMRQRLALARVYLRQPKLVLLDEPYGSLDASARELVDDLLREMKRVSSTVLIATHDVERVMSSVDLHLHLQAGRDTAGACRRGAR